jgi:hypothetical protein
MDDSIRERHGVQTTAGTHVQLVERNENLKVVVLGTNAQTDCIILPAEARYLARKLNRVARRIEERSNG